MIHQFWFAAKIENKHRSQQRIIILFCCIYNILLYFYIIVKNGFDIRKNKVRFAAKLSRWKIPY